MQDHDHRGELKVRNIENRMMQFVTSMQVPRHAFIGSLHYSFNT